MQTTIDNARTLVQVHDTGKIYGEQMRRLMQLSAEVDDIQNDLDVSPQLFTEQENIRTKLTEIKRYLEGAERVSNILSRSK